MSLRTLSRSDTIVLATAVIAIAAAGVLHYGGWPVHRDNADPGLRPLLVMAVAVAVPATAFIVFDGESTWLEGVTLIALYAIIATTFWWG